MLVYGESGTGKELIARALALSEQSERRALCEGKLWCLPHDLFESELFGHEKGAFTGAVRQKKASSS